MSRLFILTRPQLARGFQLAGADSFGASDIESAEAYVKELLDKKETGLLVIDDGLLVHMDMNLRKRLSQSEVLFHIVIPGGETLGEEYSREYRIGELIRRSIGVHVSFKRTHAQEEI